MEPWLQKISLPQPFSKYFEGVASSHNSWGEDAIDRRSSCQIPLSSDRQILTALKKFRERNSILLNCILSLKATGTSQILLSLWRWMVLQRYCSTCTAPLQIHKQAWADTHQKECSCLVGTDAVGTSEHEKRKRKVYYYKLWINIDVVVYH